VPSADSTGAVPPTLLPWLPDREAGSRAYLREALSELEERFKGLFHKEIL
jgi:hypothetical protein